MEDIFFQRQHWHFRPEESWRIYISSNGTELVCSDYSAGSKFLQSCWYKPVLSFLKTSPAGYVEAASPWVLDASGRPYCLRSHETCRARCDTRGGKQLISVLREVGFHNTVLTRWQVTGEKCGSVCHIPMKRTWGASSTFLATGPAAAGSSTGMKALNVHVCFLLGGELSVKWTTERLNYSGFLNWRYPQIIHPNGIFHRKPSIIGYPHLWKPPNG